jgi:two-component system, OmpR family, phosphate regulon response regulator PhoB
MRQGTTLQERERRGRDRPQASRPAPSREDRARPRVLVVEDNPEELDLYGKILWYNGFDVVYARDGAEGLRCADRYDPDLVLLDLGLPEMNGLELCRRLKERTASAALPVVVLTARAQIACGHQARRAGCDVYLEKPHSPLGVLKEVERLIGPAPPGAGGTPPEVENPDR